MADPFSIAIGALSVADICVRLGKYLYSVGQTVKNVDDEIKTLEHEISKFKDIYTTLGELCNASGKQAQNASRGLSGLEDLDDKVWPRASGLVMQGRGLVRELETLLRAILGDETSPRFQILEKMRKAVKFLSKDEKYTKLRKRFADLNMELSLMLTTLDLISNSLFRFETYTSLEQLPARVSQKLQELGLRAKDQTSKLETAGDHFEPSISSAKAAMTFASLNKHYYIQKSDTSIWTGRTKHLETLKDAILGPNLLRTQKRFVVCGIPGAGKTQFCCKFAQDYRESYWAIFWVDASNIQNAAESWKKIAKIGGRDPNEEAGKHWLSNLQSPWLLIIDNADNSEEFIQDHFPSGDRGSILVTTRNPRLKINATVGFMSLDRLEESEANDLLHKATNHEPWDQSARSSASSIAKHLGYLPLALVHAGRAIFHRLCTLSGYIPFFNHTLENLRFRRPSIFVNDEDDTGMGALLSFDIIYSGLEARANRDGNQAVSQDAIELINMFAFLHNNDICLDIIVKAANNSRRIQKEAADGRSKGSPAILLPRAPFLQRLKQWTAATVMKSQQRAPVLPQMLCNAPVFEESRARRAFDLLVRMSMISESSESGSYSMHPLVHVWVRKRLSTAAQALWCDTAANVLAGSIKTPPLTDDAGDQDFYVRILPHVRHVRSVHDEIMGQLQQNTRQQGMLRSWLGLCVGRPIASTMSEMTRLGKYSRVYMECAKFQEAEHLQRLVLDFVKAYAGPQHPITVQIQLALSATLWFLAQASEAQELQEEALKSCIATCGENHPQTLKTKDALGETYWQRGWLKEAKFLHESAIEGMKGNAEMTREWLKAIHHLGRVYDWYTDFDRAIELHEKAAVGLSGFCTKDDPDTLMATDHLAMSLLLSGGLANAKRAYTLMQGVHASREAKLGPEHVYTLWAACNLARCSAALGAIEKNQTLIDDAKTLFRDGIEVCERNLGADHIGTLMGRQHQTDVLVLEKKYDDAEKEYKDIAERQKYVPGARAGTHRDRIWTLQMLARCYEVQDRLEEGLAVYETIMEELGALGAQEHPVYLRTERRQHDLRARLPTSSHSSQDTTCGVDLDLANIDEVGSAPIRKAFTG